MTDHFAVAWALGIFMGMGLMKLAWERERHYQRRRAGPGHEPLPPAPMTVEEWGRRRFNHENRRGPVGPPPLKFRRIYYNMPSTIAECGGPCTSGGPEACDCGALWRDVPIKPQPPSPRKIREDFLP